MAPNNSSEIIKTNSRRVMITRGERIGVKQNKKSGGAMVCPGRELRIPIVRVTIFTKQTCRLVDRHGIRTDQIDL